MTSDDDGTSAESPEASTPTLAVAAMQCTPVFLDRNGIVAVVAAEIVACNPGP